MTSGPLHAGMPVRRWNIIGGQWEYGRIRGIQDFNPHITVQWWLPKKQQFAPAELTTRVRVRWLPAHYEFMWEEPS